MTYPMNIGSVRQTLAAYEPAWPIIVNMLDSIIKAIESNQRKATFLRPIERPRDFVYEDAVKNLACSERTFRRT
jgi:hypothetical protein